MPTTYTPLLGLALPATGELSGTWGSTVNTEITSLLDTAVAGTTTLSTDADVTLSTTTGAANQARQAIILWTANGTVTRNITAPAASKTYVVINASAGTQSVVFRGVGPTAGVTVVKGESAVVAWNGSDFIKVSNTSGAGAFTNLSVSGTTTLSGLTASTALALDASKNVVSVTNTGTGNNVLATSPVLTTPNLGTPSAATLTNATGLPVSTGISGLGTGVATALAVNTGTAGAVVVNGGALGTPSSGTVTNLTGTASININGTVGATTPNTGAFTTLSASSVVTISAGTAAAPALTTIGDLDTGVFFPSANTWAVATGGSERMRIDATGAVGIGTTSLTGYGLRVTRPITGSTSSFGVTSDGTIQPDVTTQAQMFRSNTVTAANAGTPYTVASLTHYAAQQGTFNADSTVTNQYGFIANSSLTGATNNYGFYSNIAAATGRWGFYANGTAANYFGGNTIISVTDNTNAALRVTQLGTGDALLVEDSTNPDATPFVIDASGRAVVGYTAPIASIGITPSAQVIGASLAASTLLAAGFANDATTAGALYLNKSRGAIGTIGTIVQDGDKLGDIQFAGDDGTALVRGASIRAEVDGTPGVGDMPGRMLFLTTADGGSAPGERMRITQEGYVSIANSSPQVRFTVDRLGNGSQPPSYTAGTTAAFIGSSTSSSPSYVTLISGNAAVGAIFFGDTDADSRGRVQYDHATDSMALWTGNVERVRITNAGNVGINEAAPDYRLDVNGTFGFTPGSSVTPVDNGDVVFEATNNTTLTVKLRGSDGVVRSGTITLA